MRFVTVLICALMMSLMVVSVNFAADKEESKEIGPGKDTLTYKAIPKETHFKKFPMGHPAVDRFQNHCIWVENENLYLCSDKSWW